MVARRALRGHVILCDLFLPPVALLQLIGRAAALELGIDISDYPTYSSDHNDF